MPKTTPRNKTRKSVSKRFKITGSGKILRTRAGRRHLLECKSAKRKRQLGKLAVVKDCDVPRIKACLPFG